MTTRDRVRSALNPTSTPPIPMDLRLEFLQLRAGSMFDDAYKIGYNQGAKDTADAIYRLSWWRRKLVLWLVRAKP